MSDSKPNILWVTLDSVRADHTSLHGYQRNTTPELFQIAHSQNGNKFKHGIAHSTRTPISVPSMLTGLYPSRHRMIGSESTDRIPNSMATAPYLFSECGYRTIGISENGFAGAAKGLDERFDEFTKSSPSSLGDLFSTELGYSFVKYLFNTRTHGPGLALDKHAHGKNSSFFTTDITKRKLKQCADADEPFFCYVHYNDPHHPYIPPVSYREEYIDDIDGSSEEAISFAKRMSDERWEWMANGLPISKREWEMLFAMYDATIKYVDSCVGTLFEFVQRRFENIIVIITADHGELFGEYGLLDHHTVLHDGLIHVPLVTHGLEGVDRHTHLPTQHIDVMQTLLSLVGADTSQFQGYNIREQFRETAISQALHESVDDPEREDYDRIRQYNADIDLSHLPKSLTTCARTADFKLVRTEEWQVLFNLPNEEKDVKDEYPSVFEDLSLNLDNWLENEGAPSEQIPEEADLSENMEQHLRDMGYM